MSTEIRVCRDCQAEFEIDDGQREWFLQRCLELPRRCPDCRAQRRAAKQSQSLAEPQAGTIGDVLRKQLGREENE
jgi:hypothetical protein